MKLRRLVACLFFAVLWLRASSAQAAPAQNQRSEKRIVIPNTTIDGKPFELFLDTGSDSSLITDGALERLGVDYAQPPRRSPASPGSIPLGVSAPADLVIGTQKFHLQLPIVSMPYIDGLLGWPEVKNNILVFDSDQRVVRGVAELPKETANWQKFKLGPESALTFLVPLPNGTNGTVMVDTGAFHGLALSPARWQQWRAAHPQAPTVSEPYIGISIGTGTAVEAYADDITVGPFTLTDVMVGQATPFESNNFDNYIGTFGLEALARVDLVVDGKNGYAYLHPKPKPDASHPAPKPTGRGDWSLDPAVPLNLDNLLLHPGWYYLLTGDFKAATIAWGKAAEKFPRDPVAWACLGWARENSGNPIGAAEAYHRAKMITPDVAAIMRGTGVFLQTKGDNMRAIINYEVSLAVLSGKKPPAIEIKSLDTPGRDDEAPLNQLGRDGWELIRWGNSPQAGQVHYVFQRPIPAPVGGAIKILFAEFGASDIKTDVTSIVAKFTQSGADEFFANPKWLGDDPLPGIRKNLKIDYQYNGQANTLVTAEDEPVSHDVLVENAIGHALPGPPATWEYTHDEKISTAVGWVSVAAIAAGHPLTIAPGAIFKRAIGGVPSHDIKVISAYYGIGADFKDVSKLITDLLGKPTETFTIGPEIMNVEPIAGLPKLLLLTYTVGGARQHYTTADGGVIGREILLEDTALGQDIYARLYRQILQMRLGKAPPDFMLGVAAWPDGWAKTIGQFLSGVIEEKAFFTAAQTSDIESVAGQQCEAYYFAGMMRLMNGDQGIARDYFQKSLATGITGYNEYRFASAELTRLGGPFPTAVAK